MRDWLPMGPRASARAALAAATFMLAGLVQPASADEAAAKLALSHLEAGTLAAGDAALAAIIEQDQGNDDARFGLGLIRFTRAVEHLSQGLYRYGLKPPQSVMMPIVRLPVPENLNPEEIDFEKFRAILLTFLADLTAAEQTLASVGKSDLKLPLDLTKIRYDANGDGNAGSDEMLIAVMARITGFQPEQLQQGPIVIAFDRGDVAWFRGYSHVLMALTEFLLAYDWKESFDDSFHLFFPRVQSPFVSALAPPDDSMLRMGDPFADIINFVHIRWPVREPARMAAVREHFKAMVVASRESWDLIEAETDDDREWLPNPRQTPPLAMPRVNAEQLSAWRGMLVEVDAILDGRKLVPHWRLRQGINLKRVFDEPQPFDLVLWITGPAAMPYLEDGPVSTSEEWANITNAFEGSFGSYAIWFN